MKIGIFLFSIVSCFRQATAQEGPIKWQECPEDVYKRVGLVGSARERETTDSPLNYIPKLNIPVTGDPKSRLNIRKELTHAAPNESQLSEARRHLRKLLDEGTYELSCGTKDVLLDPVPPPPVPQAEPRNLQNDDVIEVSVYRLRKVIKPLGGYTQYWALQGGPGGSGLSILFIMSDAIRNGYGDAIYIPDHRGTGRSTNLRCDSQLFDDSTFNIDPNEMRSCVRDLESEIGELQSFGTTEAAYDVLNLMEAEFEESKQVNEVRLHGFSYGSMWAQRILRINIDTVNKVVLEGVTSQKLSFNKFAVGSQTAGDLFMKKCLEDEKCKEAYPDGSASLQSFADVSNECTDYLSDSQELAQILLYLGLVMGRAEDTDGNIAVDFRYLMLAILHRIERCEGDDLEVALRTFYTLTSKVTDSMPSDRDISDLKDEYVAYSTNQVVYHLIRYSELWDDEYSESVAARDQRDIMWGNTDLKTDYQMADRFDTNNWEYAPPTSAFFYPNNANADVLVLNGEIDGQTPYDSAIESFNKITVRDDKTKKLAIVPSEGHTPSFKSCGKKIITQFFDNPSGDLDSCAMDETNNPSVEEEYTVEIPELPSDVDALLVGTDDIWDGNIIPCENLNLPPDSCEENIRVCDACYRAHSSKTLGCAKLGNILATCLDRIGCSQEYCYREFEDDCGVDYCTIGGTDDAIIIAGAVGGIGGLLVIGSIVACIVSSKKSGSGSKMKAATYIGAPPSPAYNGASGGGTWNPTAMSSGMPPNRRSPNEMAYNGSGPPNGMAYNGSGPPNGMAYNGGGPPNEMPYNGGGPPNGMPYNGGEPPNNPYYANRVQFGP